MSALDPGPPKVPPPAYAPQQQPDQPQYAPPPTYPADINSPQSVYPPQGGYVPLEVCHQQPGGVIMTAPATTVIVRTSGIQPQDYLAFAIIVTICCCLPFGIVAIIKSMDVRSRWAAGDMAGAEEASRQAKKWSVIGLVTGIILEVLGVVVVSVYYVVIIAVVVGSSGYDYGYSY